MKKCVEKNREEFINDTSFHSKERILAIQNNRAALSPILFMNETKMPK